MAAPYSHIKRKAEDAFEALINSLRNEWMQGVVNYGGKSVDVPIFKGAASDSLTQTRRIHIVAYEATAEKLDGFLTGNWFIKIQVGCVTNIKATPDRAERSQFHSAIFDLLMRDDVPDLLNALAISDFSVYRGSSKPEMGLGWCPLEPTVESRQKGDEQAEVFSGELYCKPSTGAE